MTGPDAGDRGGPLVAVRRGGEQCLGRLFIEWPDGHHLGPVLPILVTDQQQDRRAQGQPVADTSEDLGPVLLDRLAGTTSIASLSASQIDGDRLRRDGQSGRDALDRGPEGRAVRFTRGQESECAHPG